MIVRVKVIPRKDIRSPEGEVIRDALHKLGFTSVEHVWAGKYHDLTLSNDTPEETIVQMCKARLANPLVQDFTYEVIDSSTPP